MNQYCIRNPISQALAAAMNSNGYSPSRDTQRSGDKIWTHVGASSYGFQGTFGDCRSSGNCESTTPATNGCYASFAPSSSFTSGNQFWNGKP